MTSKIEMTFKKNTSNVTCRNAAVCFRLFFFFLGILFKIFVYLNIFVLRHFFIGDGWWSRWSLWSTCDVHCGHGKQIRGRACDDPPPRLLGKTCAGHTEETKPCSRGSCEISKTYNVGIVNFFWG